MDDAVFLGSFLSLQREILSELRRIRQALDGGDECCPQCGESKKVEATGAPGALGRKTCLSCGRSWVAEPEGVCVG